MLIDMICLCPFTPADADMCCINRLDATMALQTWICVGSIIRSLEMADEKIFKSSGV